MNLKEVMSALKKYGTAQNIKIYKRHGAQGDMFGVSFGNLGLLKKKIKVDHQLATDLWNTGNMDARTLAIMVADPNVMTSKEIDSWIKDIDYYLLGDMFSVIVAKSKFAKSKQSKWAKSKKEHVKQVGYAMINAMLREPDQFKDAECKEMLKTIVKEIHSSPNRARHSMYMALIGIGIYKPKLTKLAMKTSEKIGKVDVDHGETSCKTPEAIPYIQKTLKRQKK